MRGPGFFLSFFLSLNGRKPSLNGRKPSLNGMKSSLNGRKPSLNGMKPSLNGRQATGVPGLRRITSLRSVLRRARDTRGRRSAHHGPRARVRP